MPVVHARAAGQAQCQLARLPRRVRTRQPSADQTGQATIVAIAGTVIGLAIGIMLYA
ncbi:hypothetical protein MXD62_15865 [Frankia sp. Mgl5]|nr:hypothetical protein [Frankia sp. Mgl5]